MTFFLPLHLRAPQSRTPRRARAQRRSASGRLTTLTASTLLLLLSPPALRADDVSPPALLQYFESSYGAIESRMPDVFAAGYGGLYTPPSGRADSGDQSVGYDQYDRFDLGYAGNPTLYGTESGLRATIGAAHAAGLNYGIDLVWNHSGFSNSATPGFVASGGYPGLAVTLSNDVDGDYHGAFASGDQNMRLSGLLDIAQEKNYQFIRSPVSAGDPRNLPAVGTIALNGRLANVPDPGNARFYPDRSLTGTTLFDPKTNETITVYPFNNTSPLSGDAVTENATGYLMRNTQWLVQSLGIDMFRLDATKNMPPWVLNYYDRSVYRASDRTLLDGSKENVFAFGEFYDGNAGSLQAVVRKDINPATPNVIGGNRDTLDFPLFFAMRDNLSSNGLANDWRNVTNASFDSHDDGLNNGSQGVKFVSSADDAGAYLSNVAYAYTLMQPGNALVYFNAQQFGTGRSSFPKPGRGDALGGLYGDQITTLLDLRNRYGRGNYLPRQTASSTTPYQFEKENFAFERDRSALVLLSNRLDGGFDQRTVQTNFQPGQFLIELTGNAGNSSADPSGNIPRVLTVNSDKTVNVRFLRNANSSGTFTGDGYLVYGLPTPQGTVALTGPGVGATLAGSIPTTTGKTADQIAFANATTRLADLHVITGDSFNVTLNTAKVNLLNNPAYRDHDADGDRALLKLDGGIDLNGSGTVDFRNPANDVTYGFENFTTINQPGYSSADNNGTYTQSVNAASLAEGYHYLTVRGFRHRSDGGPAVFTDWRQTVYVDRLPPASSISSFEPWDVSQAANRDLIVHSDDGTATSVNVFLNLGAAVTDQQILAMAGQGNSAGQWDRDVFKYGFFGVPSGNNAVTVLTREITGNYSVKRYSGIALETGRGAGLGDTDFDGAFTAADVNGTNGFEKALYSQNQQFNPAADLNGDGKVDTAELFALPQFYKGLGAAAAAQEARSAVLRRGDINHTNVTNALDIDALWTRLGTTTDLWFDDLNQDGAASVADVDVLVHTIFHSEYGDANLDGKIDTLDFNALAANFGRIAGGWETGDFNGDRHVDTLDFNVLAGKFGWQYTGDPLGEEVVPRTSGAVVPEPTALWLLLGSLASGVRRPRQRPSAKPRSSDRDLSRPTPGR